MTPFWNFFSFFVSMYFTELQPNLKYLVCHVYYLYKIFGSKQRDLHSDDNIHFAQQYEPVLRCVPVVVPLIHTSLTASVYTTIAVAVERAATFTPSMDRVSYQNPWNIIKENRMSVFGSSARSGTKILNQSNNEINLNRNKK